MQACGVTRCARRLDAPRLWGQTRRLLNRVWRDGCVRGAATIRATVAYTSPPPSPNDVTSGPWWSSAGRVAAPIVLGVALAGAGAAATAKDAALTEVHQRPRSATDTPAAPAVLTLDACGGGFDAGLIQTLVRLRVPATVFATRRWLDRNHVALQQLRQHPELFEIENHGAAHVPAVVGRRIYGMTSPADVDGIAREIDQGAQAVAQASGRAPQWYRGAGALYDAQGLQTISRLGYRVAGFSINGDDGATASASTVARRLERTAPGDIVILHMNKPGSGTADGLLRTLPGLLARGLRFEKLSQAGEGVPVPDAPRRTAAKP